MNSAITLEQWQAFIAVVEEGSFAKAAERLNKSQSSISYLVGKLGELLPTPLLKTKGRNAVVTDAGQILYRRACNLLSQAQNIEKTAEYLAKGWESEVVIAKDALASTPELFKALQQFAVENATTRIRLLETTLSGTDEAILNKSADIALTPAVPPGFIGKSLGNVKMIAVASSSHPLHALTAPIHASDLKQHRQIVLRDTGLKREQNAGWLGSDQRWTVSHFSTSIDAVKAGLGFAFIPESKIQEELRSGVLRALPIAPSNERVLPLYLLLVHQDQSGPAARTIASQLLTSYTQRQKSES